MTFETGQNLPRSAFTRSTCKSVAGVIRLIVSRISGKGTPPPPRAARRSGRSCLGRKRQRAYLDMILLGDAVEDDVGAAQERRDHRLDRRRALIGAATRRRHPAQHCIALVD